MPSGALIEMYPFENFDDALDVVARPGSSVATPKDLLRYVRGYNYQPEGTPILSGNGATVTWAYAAGPDGLTKATRCVSTNSLGLVSVNNVNLAAGTYAISFEAKTNDASTVDVNSGESTNLSTITVTPTWQTFTKTFTRASAGNSSIYFLYRNSGSAYDILIDNVRLHAGSVDLGADTFDGHAQIGRSNTSVSSPLTSFNKNALYQLASPANLNEYTLICAFQQSSTTGATPVPFISGDNYTKLTIGAKNNGLSLLANGASEVFTTYARPNGIGWTYCIARVKSGEQELLLGGHFAAGGTYSVTSGYTPERLHSLYLGPSTDVRFTSGAIGPMVFFNSFLSEADLLTATKVIRKKMTDAGIAPVSIPYSVMFMGDSITADNIQVGSGGTGSYAHRIFAHNTSLVGGLRAIAGTGISTVTTNVSNLYPAFRNLAVFGEVPIVSIMIGTNDAQVGTDPTAYCATLATLCQNIKATGAKLLWITIPPKAEPAFATFNVGRATVNQYMRDNPSLSDAIADLDATAVGDNAAPAARVYYYDDVHPNGAGYDIIEPVVQAALDDIITAL